MTTGAEFANFTHKKISGFEDFGARMLGYLRVLHAEHLSRQFVQGSFDEKMVLSSPGVDQVQIAAKPTVPNQFDCHDGAGHVIDLVGAVKSVVFENTAAQGYEVGAGFVERPSGIAINPRTGKPDYLKLIEDVGDEADPDSVTDNGNGTITFRVDSLFEAGVAVADNTGRQVRVFKKVPADNATTEVVAIETLTVFFGGGQNQITTAGSLGQPAISTDPAEYTVQLVGITVRKDTATNKPSVTGSHFFAGVVTGNGGTPVAFDTSGQKVIAAQDAQNITFLPFVGAAPISWDIAATDVQAVIEEVVNDLSQKNSATNGANLIGVRLADFTTSVIGAGDSGGIGIGGNPDEPTSVEDALKNLDRRVVGRRPFTAVLADGTARTIADFVGATVIDQVNTIDNGGRFLLHSDGGSEYEFSAQTGFGKSTKSPVVIGEIGTGAFNGYPTVAVPAAAGVEHSLRGSFERLHLRSKSATRFLELSDSAQSFARLFQCGVDSGSMRIPGALGAAGNTNRPLVVEDTEFAPGATAGPGTSVLSYVGDATTKYPWVVFKRCVFRGPHSAVGSPESIVKFATMGALEKDIRFVVFEDCHFEHENHVSIPTVKIDGCRNQPIIFNRCRFKGIDNQTAPVVDVFNSNVSFRECVVEAPGGQGVHLDLWGGVIDDLYAHCGGAIGTADAQAFFVSPKVSSFENQSIPEIGNLKIDLLSIKPTTKPAIEFGGKDGSQVDNGPIYGRDIQIVGTGASAVTQSQVVFWGNSTEEPSVYENVRVNYSSGSNTITGAITSVSNVDNLPTWIEFLGEGLDSLKIHGLDIEGPSYRNTSAANTFALVHFEDVEVRNAYVTYQDGNGVAPGDIDSVVRLYSTFGAVGYTDVRGLSLLLPTTVGEVADYLNGAVHVQGNENVLEIIRGQKAINATGNNQVHIHVSGDQCRVLGWFTSRGAGSVNLNGDQVLVTGDGEQLEITGIRAQGANTTSRSAKLIDVTGKQARIHDNSAFIDNGGSETTVISATGSHCYVGENVLVSDEGTAPVIVNSGTGSQTGTNVLGING